MPSEKNSKFIKVDELLPQVSVEQAAAFYGILLPELHRTGSETRARCFLNCGKTQETGDRALAIQTDDPATKWHCHQYGCGKGSNLVGLCDLMKPGDAAGGRPRGERFKEIAADIASMVAGVTRGEAPARPAPAAAPAPEAPKVNLALKDSPNERARALTELDAKFTLDIARMPPAASSYFRRRPFLLPEVCREWRAGYLPRGETGEDRAGGTMRGKIVYAYPSETGDVLAWFGRDPDYETKHKAWEGTDRSEREPEKFHFNKGFHRGLQLYGEHRLGRLADETDDQWWLRQGKQLKEVGLLLVEGPNDVIRMATLGVSSLGLCSNTITREQAAKVASLARKYAGGVVTIFLDCDPEGENGMKQCLGYLAQLCAVRLAWTSKMFGGGFRGRQPESLRQEEWAAIRAYLLTGHANGWSLT